MAGFLNFLKFLFQYYLIGFKIFKLEVLLQNYSHQSLVNSDFVSLYLSPYPYLTVFCGRNVWKGKVRLKLDIIDLLKYSIDKGTGINMVNQY